MANEEITDVVVPLNSWPSLMPDDPIYQLPKGYFGVYVYWSLAEDRSAQARSFLPPVKGLLPFYVGYGQKNRPFNHLKETPGNTQNPYKTAIILKERKHGREPFISLAYVTQDEDKALLVERLLELLIGRIDLETGPLTNLRDCGLSGVVGPEGRRKLARFAQERANTEEGRAHLHAAMESARTPEARAKISKAAQERMQTDEGQANLRKAVESARKPEARAKNSRAAQLRAKTEQGRTHLRDAKERSKTPDAIAKMAATLRKFTPETAATIRQRVTDGETKSALAREHNVAYGTMLNICKGKNGY